MFVIPMCYWSACGVCTIRFSYMINVFFPQASGSTYLSFNAIYYRPPLTYLR